MDRFRVLTDYVREYVIFEMFNIKFVLQDKV